MYTYIEVALNTWGYNPGGLPYLAVLGGGPIHMGIDPPSKVCNLLRIRWPHTHGDRAVPNGSARNRMMVAPYTWGKTHSTAGRYVWIYVAPLSIRIDSEPA